MQDRGRAGAESPAEFAIKLILVQQPAPLGGPHRPALADQREMGAHPASTWICGLRAAT